MIRAYRVALSTRLANLVLTAAFLGTLTVPLAGHVCGLEGAGPLRENRGLTARPRPGTTPRQCWRFVLRYREYFNDHFGLRPLLVRIHAMASVAWLDSAPNERVLLGREGWLYLNKWDQGIESTRAVDPFTPQDLKQWRRVLERRRDVLGQRGITYVFTVAPDKSTIYPEYLPPSVTRVHPQSRLEQLFDYLREHGDYLREHGDATLVDLRPALLAAKHQRPVYYQTDTHWNEWGAYVAYREIVAALHRRYPGLEAKPPSAFSVETLPGQFSGGLADMAGLSDYLREDEIRLTPLSPGISRTVSTESGRNGDIEFSAAESPNPAAPRLVMLHDSFGDSLKALLSEHFRRAAFFRTPRVSLQVLDREKPDVVIQEIVERSLMNGPPKAPLDD